MKIIIVDDDKFIQGLISKNVESFGLDTLIFSNGKDALDFVKKSDEPILAVVDWMMPVMNGLQLCRSIRAIDRKNYIYILMLTAKNSDDDIISGLDAGADDYIVKPFEREEFRSRLKTGFRILDNEIKLIDNHNYLVQTINTLDECLIRTDNYGKIEYFNKATCELTGYKEEQLNEFYLKDILNLQNIENMERITNPLGNSFRDKETFEPTQKFLFVDKYNKKIPVTYKIAPIFSKPGKTIGFVCVIRNQSEQTKIEEQLKQSSKMETIGKLAGGIAHDFNNMLGGIIGYSEMLVRRVKDDEKSHKYSTFILQTAKRSSSLVGKLLAFARKRDYTPVPVDLHMLIDEVISLLSCSIEKQIEMERELNSEYHYILGEPTQLQNLLLNLGVNAFDAMPEGGTLKFTTTNIEIDEKYIKKNYLEANPGAYVEIIVSDTGIGMNADIVKKIFDPFFTTKEEGKGTGLGLASVKQTLSDHKGSIMVESIPEKGSTFRILFPVSTKTKTPAEDFSDDLSEGTGTVLVVDDELVVREMAADLLKTMGYEVITAENGVEAVSIYEENKDSIDLVLLDVIMPKMGGSETFNKIKEINNNANIVITSGFAVDEEIGKMINNGALGFIKKPYYATSFSQKIACYIKSKELTES